MRHEPYHHIDPFVLFGTIGEDLESFRALSQTFLDIAPPMLERLEQAILAGNSQLALYESHSLKGSTSLIGAVQLSSLLQDIESLPPGALKDGGVPRIAELVRIFDIVMQEVRSSIVHFQGMAQS